MDDAQAAASTPVDGTSAPASNPVNDDASAAASAGEWREGTENGCPRGTTGAAGEDLALEGGAGSSSPAWSGTELAEGPDGPDGPDDPEDPEDPKSAILQTLSALSRQFRAARSRCTIPCDSRKTSASVIRSAILTTSSMVIAGFARCCPARLALRYVLRSPFDMYLDKWRMVSAVLGQCYGGARVVLG